MAVGSDNVWPKLIVAEGAAPSSPSAGQQKLFIDSSDHKLKRKDSSGTVTTIEGGGSGSTIKDRRWTAASGSTSIDEFNTGALDPAWVRVDGTNAPAGNVTWAVGGDTLSAKQTGLDTGNAMHALLRPLSAIGGPMVAGDAFITALEIFGKIGTNYSVSGLVVADGTTYGSGTQIAAEMYIDAATPVGNYENGLGGTTGFTGAATGTGGGTNNLLRAGLTYLRLVYLGSNQWRSDRSPDGVQWLNGSVLTLALTPTYVGLSTRKPAAGEPHITTYEFLRRASGVS